MPDFSMGNDDYIGIAVDGEIYKVRGGISLNVYIDPDMPKMRIMRRMPDPEKDITSKLYDLGHLSPPFI